MDNSIILRRETTACFTGHRPQKLPDGGSRNSTATRVIKSMLYACVSEAVNDGYDTFITGMQRGIDLWAGEIVLSLMAGSNLRLICAMPYEGFGKEFTGVDKWTFERILEAASAKVTLCPRYTKDCMALRNKFMVDNSSRLIAVADDLKSGTGQTLRYARSSNLDIRLIDLGELFRKNNTDTRDFADAEANKQSYDVITFDGMEEDMSVASRNENPLPVETDKSELADLFGEPISELEILGNSFSKMPDKTSAKPSAEKSEMSHAEKSVGKSSVLPRSRTAETFSEKIPENANRRQETPAADLEIDERYSAANDPTLTLL